MNTATEKTWEEMDASERNAFIGELIGAKPLSAVYVARNGVPLFQTAYSLDSLPKLNEDFIRWQSSDKEWAALLAECPSLRPEWKGQISAVEYQWPLRYCDTPAGGWKVIEHLRAKGFAVTIYSEPADNWRLLVKERAGDRSPGVNAVSPDIHVAACEVARRILDR